MTFLQSYKELEKLATQNRIDDFKNQLKHSNPSDLVDDSESTLLHIAAEKGNLKLLNLLLSSQDINVQDANGTTPILMAAKNRHFNVVQALLTSGANIFISNAEGLSLLDILINLKFCVPMKIFEDIFEKLNSSGMDIKDIVEMLVKSNCTLSIILLMKNPKVTLALLESKENMSIIESCAAVNRAICLADLENLEVLLLHGPAREYRQKVFIQFMCESLLDTKLNVDFNKLFWKNLIKWDLIDDRLVNTCREICQKSNLENILLLLDCQIDKFVRAKCDFDVIPDIIVNTNFDVCDLLKKINIDPNAENQDGLTALQISLRYKIDNVVKLLLELGADPNLTGRVLKNFPLNIAKTERSVFLLLHYGAANTYIKYGIPGYLHCHWKKYYEYVISKNVLDLICGKPMDQRVIKHLKQPRGFSDQRFDNYSKQIEWTKEQIIVEDSLKIFDIFTMDIEILSKYIKNKDTVNQILDKCREEKLCDFYLSALENNLNNAVLMHEGKMKVAELIVENTNINNVEHVAIRKILKYLKFKDLLALMC